MSAELVDALKKKGLRLMSNNTQAKVLVVADHLDGSKLNAGPRRKTR